jgi:hypothetical protein
LGLCREIVPVSPTENLEIVVKLGAREVCLTVELGTTPAVIGALLSDVLRHELKVAGDQFAEILAAIAEGQVR